MDRRKICLLGLIATILMVFFTASVAVANAKDIYVPEHYEMIQAAVDDASEGGTIIVRNGTYNESVDVTKRLTIRSENGPANCIVKRFNWDEVDYVNIKGFTVTGGIHFSGSKHCDVSNNRISNCDEGIGVVYGSNYNTLSGNVVSNCNKGISVLYGGNYNTITKNHISDNGDGIYFDYMDCNGHSTITDNVVSNNDRGISLCCACEGNTVTGNTLSNNNCGLYLYDCACGNTITNNFITGNYCGISIGLEGCGNLIYNNYFDNKKNAVDEVGNNTWYISERYEKNIIGGPKLGGNYWSDYAGEDNDAADDRDGFGDTLLPFTCNGEIINGGDYRPLVDPKTNPCVFDNHNSGSNDT